MPAIVTSRTKLLYERPPSPPFDINWEHHSTRGIVACWPFGESNLLGYNWQSPIRYKMAPNGTAPAVNPGPSGGYSLRFNGSNTDMELASTAVVTANPASLECYCWPTDTTNQQCLVVVENGDSGSIWMIIELAGHVAGDPARAQQQQSGATETFAASTNAYIPSTWNHVFGCFPTTSLRWVQLNGIGYGQETTTHTLSGLSRTAAGAFRVSSSYFSPYAGRLADVIVRNVALSPAEAAERADPGKRYAIYAPLGRKSFSFKATSPPPPPPPGTAGIVVGSPIVGSPMVVGSPVVGGIVRGGL